MNTIKTYSTGGFGDFFIVYLKLLDEVRAGNRVDHLHIESNEIVPSLVNEFIKYLHGSFDDEKISVQTLCDPKYQQNIPGGIYQGRAPRNTHVMGTADYPGPDNGIKNSALTLYKQQKKHKKRVSLQVSAGAKSDRKWNFDVMKLRSVLISLGYEVFLVGNDKNYENDNYYNFVNKKLGQALYIIESCSYHIGLSGFLTYYSLSLGVKNLHLPESPDHVKRYIHPEWEKNRYNLQFGSMSEIIKGLKFLENKT